MDRRMIGIAVAVALGAAGTGYALGGYATGGSEAGLAAEPQDRAAFWHEDAAARSLSDTPSLPEESGASAPRPEHYVCHGCGPTLAERRAQARWDGGPAEARYPESDGNYSSSL